MTLNTANMYNNISDEQVNKLITQQDENKLIQALFFCSEESRMLWCSDVKYQHNRYEVHDWYIVQMRKIKQALCNIWAEKGITQC